LRLVIGYDGSAFADSVFSDLHRAGLPTNVEATVLCVADAWLPPGIQASDERVSRNVAGLIEQARELAENGAARLREEFPTWSVTAETVTDSPAWALIKHSEGLDRAWSADLTVVGAAGRSALGRMFFGSVAHGVVVNSSRSVRVARSTSTRSGADPVRLVIGMDGSAEADNAVVAVAARTWGTGTQCRIVTAVDEAIGDRSGAMAMQTLRDRATQHAEALKRAGLDVTFHFRPGRPPAVLIQEAEQLQADCIYVGARGLGRVDRFVLGSTSSSVAMRAPCSVEIVHPPK
jgi:nucleotide-binding universal stress UspA family protein